MRRRAGRPRLPRRPRARAASGSSELGLDHLVVPAAGDQPGRRDAARPRERRRADRRVGAHFNLTEFLDKNRAGMSSTFLTRLRIGETLVDAKGVSRLYNPGVRGWHMWAFLGGRADRDRDRRARARRRLAEFFDLVWLKIKVLLGSSDGLLRALPRGLAGRRLPRARDRDPDRRGSAPTRQRHRRRPREEPAVRPRRRERADRRPPGPARAERDVRDRRAIRRSSEDQLGGQTHRPSSRSATCRTTSATTSRDALEPAAARLRRSRWSASRPTRRARRRSRAGNRRAAREQERAQAAARKARRPPLVRGGPFDDRVRETLLSRTAAGGPARRRDRSSATGPRLNGRDAEHTDALEDGLIDGMLDRRACPSVGAERADADPSLDRRSSPTHGPDHASTTSTGSPARSRCVYALAARGRTSASRTRRRAAARPACASRGAGAASDSAGSLVSAVVAALCSRAAGCATCARAGLARENYRGARSPFPPARRWSRAR